VTTAATRGTRGVGVGATRAELLRAYPRARTVSRRLVAVGGGISYRLRRGRVADVAVGR
jgi:hypothetical protein